MNTLTTKNLIDFARRKTDSSKKTFVEALRRPKPKPNPDEEESGGGNYWIHSISYISKAFKNNSSDIIDNQLIALDRKIREAKTDSGRSQFSANIPLLKNFSISKFTSCVLRDAHFIISKGEVPIFTIKGIDIIVKPVNICVFKDQVGTIGAVWFVVTKGGFTTIELGMYAEALYKYLHSKYAASHNIDEFYCTAIDVITHEKVNYQSLVDNAVSSRLEPVANEIVRFFV